MLSFRPLILALIVVSSATPLIGAPDAAENFRAAVAKVDITPSASKWPAGYPPGSPRASTIAFRPPRST